MKEILEEQISKLVERQSALEAKLDNFASQTLEILKKLSQPPRKSFKIYERTEGNYSSSSDEGTDSPPVPAVSSAATSPIKATVPNEQSRVILTTYPGQVGILPIPMNWGSSDPKIRGPIVASRHSSSIKKRNATGAHGGSYAVSKISYNANRYTEHWQLLWENYRLIISRIC